MGAACATQAHYETAMKGKAAITNSYVEYPDGVAAKALWASYRNSPYTDPETNVTSPTCASGGSFRGS